ncbi:CYFA0S15e01486g1_1 [Cyberlindnera fabianii]|uniref:CYFA0S15e01486g1_1 n=1 Tax=Cyberlindnera fabianii TaxID=36022 RepID=A0A061B4F6_CYBFA|nr:CYFA0S15e01486g1_1 [Cyberlindnera fabianii]
MQRVLTRCSSRCLLQQQQQQRLQVCSQSRRLASSSSSSSTEKSTSSSTVPPPRAPSSSQINTVRLINDIKKSIVKIPSPRKLKNYLDNYIVGQETGKRVMSVAVFNHYLRINDKARKLAKKIQERQQKEDDEMYTLRDSVKPHNRSTPEEIAFRLDDEDNDLELSKSNILVLGPSGSGKTLIAKTLARVLNVPFSITDCTQLTQAGYIGEDVELCIERLLVNSEYDVERAEKGIVVLDEIDKLSKPLMGNGVKDVSGEGVQQALLKLIEGTTVQVQVKKPVNKDKDAQNNNTTSKKNEMYHIDTSNILFVLMGAFVGLDEHVVKRVTSNELGKLVEGDYTRHSIRKIEVEDGRQLNSLELVTPQDLTSYGMIPELVGRVPVVTSLDPLNEVDLLSILTEPKNAILAQYQYIFEQFGVKLVVTKDALSMISGLALKEGTGARGLRGIMERLLLDINYECPDSGIQFVLVDSVTVESLKTGKAVARYYARGDLFKFVDDVTAEDAELGKQLKEELLINTEHHSMDK